MLWVIWCAKSWIRKHTERTSRVFLLSSNRYLCGRLCKKQFPAKYFPSVNPTMQCAMQHLRLKRLTDIETGDLSVVPGRELYSSFVLTWKPSEQLVMRPSCGQLFQVCSRDCFYWSSSGPSKAGEVSRIAILASSPVEAASSFPREMVVRRKNVISVVYWWRLL